MLVRVKPWHGMVVAVALLAIVAYLAMIVGPRFIFGHVKQSVHQKARTMKTAIAGDAQSTS